MNSHLVLVCRSLVCPLIFCVCFTAWLESNNGRDSINVRRRGQAMTHRPPGDFVLQLQLWLFIARVTAVFPLGIFLIYSSIPVVLFTLFGCNNRRPNVSQKYVLFFKSVVVSCSNIKIGLIENVRIRKSYYYIPFVQLALVFTIAVKMQKVCGCIFEEPKQ